MKIKKFKHKKTGHIFEQDGSYYNRPKHECIPAWLVEDSNDWEEIIEKDYEILSYYAKNIAGKGDTYVDPTYIWKQKSLGQWSRFYDNQFHTGPYSTEAITNHNGYGIHSIRRISDGEIFTIGDNITYNNEKTIIEGFNLQFNKYLIADFKKTVSNCIGCNINYIQKAKQPLFTTEDGVDIFEGATFYHVDLNWYIGSGRTTTHPFQKLKGYKEFSTKEKAQEYIDLNKPKYSLNDILSVAKDYYVMPQSFIDKLKQLNK